MSGEYKVAVPATVRWGDLDSFGHVNNAVYFTFCESARIAYFTAVGISADRSVATHAPVLAQATLNFRRQVHYPAELEARARCPRLGTKSFALDYQIVDRANGEVVADGTSVIAWLDYATGRTEKLPAALRKIIAELDDLPGDG